MERSGEVDHVWEGRTEWDRQHVERVGGGFSTDLTRGSTCHRSLLTSASHKTKKAQYSAPIRNLTKNDMQMISLANPANMYMCMSVCNNIYLSQYKYVYINIHIYICETRTRQIC